MSITSSSFVLLWATSCTDKSDIFTPFEAAFVGVVNEVELALSNESSARLLSQYYWLLAYSSSWACWTI